MSKNNEFITRKYPRCIATISAGFEKGDFLVREEKGQRVYFDFFEEAFNYIAAKGYSRMPKVEEGEWMDLMVSNIPYVDGFALLVFIMLCFGGCEVTYHLGRIECAGA